MLTRIDEFGSLSLLCTWLERWFDESCLTVEEKVRFIPGSGHMPFPARTHGA